MKIVLREFVKGLGERGAVVDVSNGYARNYLIPHKLAYSATEKSVNRLKEGDIKRDVGVELRGRLITLYRFPTLLYARVAWPLDDMSGSAYENDARRFYFGLRM